MMVQTSFIYLNFFGIICHFFCMSLYVFYFIVHQLLNVSCYKSIAAVDQNATMPSAIVYTPPLHIAISYIDELLRVVFVLITYTQTKINT